MLSVYNENNMGVNTYFANENARRSRSTNSLSLSTHDVQKCLPVDLFFIAHFQALYVSLSGNCITEINENLVATQDS